MITILTDFSLSGMATGGRCSVSIHYQGVHKYSLYRDDTPIP